MLFKQSFSVRINQIYKYNLVTLNSKYLAQATKRVQEYYSKLI